MKVAICVLTASILSLANICFAQSDATNVKRPDNNIKLKTVETTTTITTHTSSGNEFLSEKNVASLINGSVVKDKYAVHTSLGDSQPSK